MSPGKLAAQAVHAATGKRHCDYSMNVVVLAVSDKKFREIVEAENAFVVRDAGHTEIEPGTETCAAFYCA
jgi:peptidyl-tRNA hydrolase